MEREQGGGNLTARKCNMYNISIAFLNPYYAARPAPASEHRYLRRERYMKDELSSTGNRLAIGSVGRRRSDRQFNISQFGQFFAAASRRARGVDAYCVIGLLRLMLLLFLYYFRLDNCRYLTIANGSPVVSFYRRKKTKR
jgi:hypothetical protein